MKTFVSMYKHGFCILQIKLVQGYVLLSNIFIEKVCAKKFKSKYFYLNFIIHCWSRKRCYSSGATKSLTWFLKSSLSQKKINSWQALEIEYYDFYFPPSFIIFQAINSLLLWSYHLSRLLLFLGLCLEGICLQITIDNKA